MSTTLQLTEADLQMIMTDLGTTTKVFVAEKIKQAVEPLEQRISELSARLSQVEGAKYAGVWRADVPYQAGASTTHRNGLWYARADSCGSRPGTSKDWQLASRGGIGED